MIGESAWIAGVAAAVAGGWAAACGFFHMRSRDGMSMRQQYERAEEETRRAEARYEEARGRADATEKVARRCDDLRQEMEVLRREYASLDKERAALDEFARQEETKLRDLAREGEAIRGKREEAESRTDELARKEAALGEEINRKQAELDGLQQGVQDGEKARRKIEEEIDEVAGKLAAAQERLQRETDAAEEAKRRVSDAQDTMAALARQDTTLREEIRSKQDEWNVLEQNLQIEKDMRKKLVEELDQMNGKLAVAEKDLQYEREAADEAKRRASDAQDTTDALARREAALAKEIDAKQVRLDALEEGLQTGKEERKALDEELKSKQATRKEMEEELTLGKWTLEELKEEAEDAERQADKAKEETAKAQRSKEMLEHDIVRLEKRLEGAEGLGTEAMGEGGEGSERGRLGNLETPPGCVPEKRGQGRWNDESEALDEVLEEIRHQQGLKVSQRMLRRLHTSLKVAEVSPLTVLAGISGTGKTQLPRAYAEAMGMCLLVVPVQPRWDSPMDLVGSYDYMHKRYQATELARLLWNFDQARRDRDRNKDKYQDDNPMAMVLLDEMNLARTEYYFSDFLSRLELRRAGAEWGRHAPGEETMIELDMPHGEGGQPEKLYPSERILWVGTMNEDETTQTLSDKVIDRSNVMRFPRPERIQFKAGAKGGTGRAKGESRKELTAGRWLHWCREREMPKEAERTIEKINKVMEEVGRPFGHRMGQAMARYVERYPSDQSDKWRTALSDQIDMRVLTKLTGLDGTNDGAQSALDELRKICEEDLEDEMLAEAVGKATEVMHSAGTFAWTGYQIG